MSSRSRNGGAPNPFGGMPMAGGVPMLGGMQQEPVIKQVEVPFDVKGKCMKYTILVASENAVVLFVEHPANEDTPKEKATIVTMGAHSGREISRAQEAIPRTTIQNYPDHMLLTRAYSIPRGMAAAENVRILHNVELWRVPVMSEIVNTPPWWADRDISEKVKTPAEASTPPLNM